MIELRCMSVGRKEGREIPDTDRQKKGLEEGMRSVLMTTGPGKGKGVLTKRREIPIPTLIVDSLPNR